MAKPMTLDEAIQHAKEVADQHGDTACGREHQQLLKWLEDYQELRKTTKEALDDMSDLVANVPWPGDN